MEKSINLPKLNAVKYSLNLLKSNKVIGLGSGSTIEMLIEEISKMLRIENLDVSFIPASTQTYFKLINLGIKPASLDTIDEIDITFDGADEVDERKYVLKGRGGALFREKILSYFSKKYIIIVDDSKYSKKIGEKSSVAIEVLPYAINPVFKKIQKICKKAEIRYGGRIKDGPIITDNGNYIIDAYFGEIDDPLELSNQINSICGVIENGIFYQNITKIIVGYEKEVKVY